MLNYASRKHLELNFAQNKEKNICEFDRAWIVSQTEVSALSPRVAFLDHQRSLLTLGNSHLKQRIAALAQDKIFKDGDRHCRRLPDSNTSPVTIGIQFGAACMQDCHDDDGVPLPTRSEPLATRI